ncbi:MAG: hypothetical protein ACK5LP_01375 [Campylobacteraceae bacterium]
MFIPNSGVNKTPQTQNDEATLLIEGISLISQNEWYTAFSIFKTLTNSNNICVIYNLSLCYKQADEVDNALMFAKKANELNKSLATSPKPLTNTLIKLKNIEEENNSYLLALTPAVVKHSPELVAQRVTRLLIDLHVKKENWQEVVRLCNQLANTKCQNVHEALKIAKENL